VTFTSQLGGDPPRVIVQLLEGGAASGAMSPDAAAGCLREALASIKTRRALSGSRGE